MWPVLEASYRFCFTFNFRLSYACALIFSTRIDLQNLISYLFTDNDVILIRIFKEPSKKTLKQMFQLRRT